MQYRYSLVFIIGLQALGACSDSTNAGNDLRDRNRSETYGAQCDAQSDCASPLKCLERSDGGVVSPLCTISCEAATECPKWNATGHCAGPIRPTCFGGVCDYQRCK